MCCLKYESNQYECKECEGCPGGDNDGEDYPGIEDDYPGFDT